MIKIEARDRTLVRLEGSDKAEPILLERIKERLKNHPDVYFAGELFSKKDDGSRFDIHDLFIAPNKPIFDPEELTTFIKDLLIGFDMEFIRSADLREDGDMQLPDAFIDEPIGTRESRVTTKTKITKGTFKGEVGEKVEADTYTEILIQRTMIKVYTDPHFAQVMFDYCNSLLNKELDEQQSPKLFAVYATHIARAEHLKEIKKHYRRSKRLLSSLPEGK